MAKFQKLTRAQERFVSEFLIDANATAAYLRAFPGSSPTSARSNASRLVANDNVQAAITAAYRELRRRSRVSAARVLRELADIAFADIGEAFDLSATVWQALTPREMSPAVRRAIARIKVTRSGTTETIEVRFHDKVTALDRLARHLGLFAPLPALEVLLSALPPEIARAVREAIDQVLSTRAIADAVGVDQKTVRNDLKAGEDKSSPDPDPAPEPEEPD